MQARSISARRSVAGSWLSILPCRRRSWIFSAGRGRAFPCINSRPAEEYNKPWSAPAREARSGRSHRIDRRLAAQDTRDVGRALALQLFERFDRIERGMRGEDDVIAADQLRILRQ